MAPTLSRSCLVVCWVVVLVAGLRVVVLVAGLRGSVLWLSAARVARSQSPGSSYRFWRRHYTPTCKGCRVSALRWLYGCMSMVKEGCAAPP